MSKLDKKKAKLEERIQALEEELLTSLTKKCSVVEINVPLQHRKIAELREQLSKLAS